MVSTGLLVEFDRSLFVYRRWMKKRHSYHFIEIFIKCGLLFQQWRIQQQSKHNLIRRWNLILFYSWNRMLDSRYRLVFETVDNGRKFSKPTQIERTVKWSLQVAISGNRSHLKKKQYSQNLNNIRYPWISTWRKSRKVYTWCHQENDMIERVMEMRGYVNWTLSVQRAATLFLRHSQETDKRERYEWL
jgi:hypothetical protein